jgi:hypothetical protein
MAAIALVSEFGFCFQPCATRKLCWLLIVGYLFRAELKGLVAQHQVSMLVTGHFFATNQHTSRGIDILIRARHQSILCRQILSLFVGPQRLNSLESWVPKHFPNRSSCYKVRPLRLQPSHGIRPKPVAIVCGPWAYGRLRELLTSLHARIRAASSH